MLGIAILLLLSQSACSLASAQTQNAPPTTLELDANRLARDVLQNEIQAEIDDDSLWCYRELREEQGENKLFGVCQTKDGEIDRLLEVDGRELSPTERQAEDQRIQKMLNDPNQMRQQQKKRQDDGKQERDMLKMFPDAFRFQYDGMQGNLIKLKFTPNPDFHASRRAAQVFRHMQGSLLLDPEQKRLAEIEGQLISDVKFGWGLLGHLDKGGTFRVQQEDLGSRHWELTFLDVEMKGKALLFKSIAVREKVRDTDFQLVPDDLKPEEAFEILRQERRSGKCPEGDCSKAQGAPRPFSSSELPHLCGSTSSLPRRKRTSANFSSSTKNKISAVR